ncbi:MAG: indolepyruvate oxidoreductase, partial [Gammaproteobacteria bacterium]
MKYDIIISGVGGQGILAIAMVLGKACIGENLQVRQSEIHG